MLRLERVGNDMSARQPLAEINQFAAVRTKRAVWAGEPITGFPAGWTFDLGRAFHANIRPPGTAPHGVAPTFSIPWLAIEVFTANKEI